MTIIIIVYYFHCQYDRHRYGIIELHVRNHASRITVTSCTLIYVESWYAHDWTFAFGMIGPEVEGFNHDWTYRTHHVQYR